MKKKFNLLIYKEQNLVDLFKWRNDAIVRSNSLNKNVIELDVHKRWIKKKISYNKNKIYIFYLLGNPIGMCAIIKKKKFFYLNYLIDRKFRNKGLSKIMLKMFFKKIKNNFYKNKVFAIVLKKNIFSYKALSQLNFFVIQKENNYIKMKLNY